MWCVLENKVPTWDFLQKRSLQGPRWCILSQDDGESIMHRVGWCSKFLKVPCVWEGPTILQAWSNWKVGTDLELMEALPLLFHLGCVVNGNE